MSAPKKKMDFAATVDLGYVEEQWKEWSVSNPPDSFPDVTEDQLREALIQDLTNVSKMSVEEYTLYQKWCEIQERYPTHTVSTLFGEQQQMKDLEEEKFIQGIKANIWIPESPDDYAKLEPVLIYTKDAELSETWNCIRTFTSNMKNNSNIGRNLNYIVADSVTGKYLGVICISGDFLDLTARDKVIGWDRTAKTLGMIKHTAIGSTIVPVQPLGYNYVGGKLLALLCLSDEVQHQWKKQYGETLVGVTTTSLWGKGKGGHGMSQYDNLKHWKKMGYSAGSVNYEPTKPTIALIRTWLSKYHQRKYFEWYIAKRPNGQGLKRDHRNRSYMFTYSRLNIPKNLIKSNHERGIYFSFLYTNTNEFLRQEIKDDQLVKAFDTSYTALGDLWKTKYASKRIRSLTDQNRVSTETLFYDDFIYNDWETTKEKYLGAVGR